MGANPIRASNQGRMWTPKVEGSREIFKSDHFEVVHGNRSSTLCVALWDHDKSLLTLHTLYVFIYLLHKNGIKYFPEILCFCF